MFIAAHVDEYFHLTEVEVFDGRLTRSFAPSRKQEHNQINYFDSGRYVAQAICVLASGSAGPSSAGSPYSSDKSRHLLLFLQSTSMRTNIVNPLNEIMYNALTSKCS